MLLQCDSKRYICFSETYISYVKHHKQETVILEHIMECLFLFVCLLTMELWRISKLESLLPYIGCNSVDVAFDLNSILCCVKM